MKIHPLVAAAALLVVIGCGDASSPAGDSPTTVEFAAQPILAEMSDSQLTTNFGWKTMHQNSVLATGTRPLLVLYREYPGAPMSHDPTYYDNLIFGHGAHSVVDYFTQVSNGQFTWTKAGLVVNRAIDVYADAPVLYANAISQASALGFNFAQYDRNGDGYITMEELGILIIMSNDQYGANNRATSPVNIPVAGGKTVIVNAVGLGHRASFASYAHELLHQLGAIDMYYTRDNVNHLNDHLTVMGGTIVDGVPDVMDTWDLDPYHKIRLGWVRPKVRTLSDTGTATLAAASVASTTAISNESPVLAYDPAKGTHQYFMIEHRSRLGFDAQVGGRGVALWEAITDASHNPEVMSSGIPARGVYNIVPTGGMAGSPWDGLMTNNGIFYPIWYTGTAFYNRFRVTSYSSNLQTADLAFGPNLVCNPPGLCSKNTTWDYNACKCVPNLPPGPTGGGGSAIVGLQTLPPESFEFRGVARRMAPMNCFGDGRSQP